MKFNYKWLPKMEDMPWSWTIVRSDILWPDGTLYARDSFKRKDRGLGISVHGLIDEHGIVDVLDLGLVERHPYTYMLENGMVQFTIATIFGEEREWRMNWFKWFPFINKVERTISVRFDSAIGDDVGTWKGGVLTCSWKWPTQWTLHEALLEMEQNRKFKR